MTIESPVYEWLTREAAEEGHKKGLTEGIKEGKQEGALQEAQETVIDNLKIRFKKIPQTVLKTIKMEKDIAQLRALRKRALTVQSLEEFKTILMGE